MGRRGRKRQLSARLVLGGGFTVSDRQQRHLLQQATRLGYTSLRARLQALLDGGCSIPQLATHFDTTQVLGLAPVGDVEALPGHSSWG